MVARQVRVNLDQFDPNWHECYVIVRTKPVSERLKYETDMEDISTQLSELQRKLYDVGNAIDNTILSEAEDAKKLKIQSIKLRGEAMALTEKIYDTLKDLIKSAVVSGLIFDVDKQSKIPFAKEHIDELDTEVLGYIRQYIFDGTSKND